MKIFKILLLSFLIFNYGIAKKIDNTISTNTLYILPDESKKATQRIIELIENSQDSILIAMYNFSYKKFLKSLINSSKKGINITVILDYKKNLENKKIYKELVNNNINIVIAKNKMHIKAAIFDNKTAIIGSSNWTKESFKENHEVILITEDKKVIFKLENELKNIK